MIKTGKEYAVALFSLACEQGIEETVLKDLELVKSVFETTDGIVSLLSSPAIYKSDRLDIIEKSFSGSVSQTVLSFMMLLCKNGNISLLFNCITEYNKLYKQSRRIISATIKSAVELNDIQKEKLKVALEHRLGFSVDAEYTVDPKIVGGIVIETDGMKFDGSVLNRIKQIKEEVLVK